MSQHSLGAWRIVITVSRVSFPQRNRRISELSDESGIYVKKWRSRGTNLLFTISSVSVKLQSHVSSLLDSELPVHRRYVDVGVARIFFRVSS